MSFIIYHNPRCAKSRKGLKYLQSKTDDIIVYDYIKKGISLNDLKEIILKMNVKPDSLVRESEELFKKELRNKKFTDEEWLIILSENPRLIKRPVIAGKFKAVIGDPVENIDKLIHPNLNNPK